MNKKLLLVPIIFTLIFGFEVVSEAQTNSTKTQFEPDKNKPKVIALTPSQARKYPMMPGTVRFLASSEDTNGAFSLFELKEMPGYKTALHQHNHWDESFYVMEGVLTVKIKDKISEYPAGSYVVIPRGTPHGQGNFGTVPTRILLTFTPSAYEQFFRDRVELFKTVKPTDPKFTDRFNELRRKHAKYVEILGTWDIPK
jgi:quercetin dioxygenase-like cupin family protein